MSNTDVNLILTAETHGHIAKLRTLKKLVQGFIDEVLNMRSFFSAHSVKALSS